MRFLLRSRLALASAALALTLVASSQIAPRINAQPTLGPQYPIDHAPIGLDVDEQTNRVFVANLLGNNEQGSFSVVDITTGNVQNVPFPIPQDVVHNDATGKAYISGGGESGVVGVIQRDNTTNVLKTISVGGTPKWMAVNEATNRIYVALHTGRALAVIDGNSDSVIATVDLSDRNPVMPAVDVGANKVYVTGFISKGRIAVIDANSNTKVGDLALRHEGMESMEAVVDQSTGRLFVTHNDGVGWVSAFDRSGTRIAERQISTRVTGLTFNPITSRVFVSNEYGEPANEHSRSVSVLDTSLNEQQIIPMPEGGIPGPAINVDERCSRVYVGNTYSRVTGPRTIVRIQDDLPQAASRALATPGTIAPAAHGSAHAVYMPLIARASVGGGGGGQAGC